MQVQVIKKVFSNAAHVRLHANSFEMFINRSFIVAFLPNEDRPVPLLGIIKTLSELRLFYLATEIIL